MAEDVIDSLEKMRLTSEEEEIIALPDERHKEEIGSFLLVSLLIRRRHKILYEELGEWMRGCTLLK